MHIRSAWHSCMHATGEPPSKLCAHGGAVVGALAGPRRESKRGWSAHVVSRARRARCALQAQRAGRRCSSRSGHATSPGRALFPSRARTRRLHEVRNPEIKSCKTAKFRRLHIPQVSAEISQDAIRNSSTALRPAVGPERPTDGLPLYSALGCLTRPLLLSAEGERQHRLSRTLTLVSTCRPLRAPPALCPRSPGAAAARIAAQPRQPPP